MAGHSHWAGIKHKKALVDAKRGKLWSKLAKAIIVAAKQGGGNPDENIRLRAAIDEARAVSLPKDNITRAIKRGTGELDPVELEEVLYEGYGVEGVAVMAAGLTDNRNRTAPEIRKIFEVCGGKLGQSGCVAWNFDLKGVIEIPADVKDEEEILELAIEAGADNVESDEEVHKITCAPEVFDQALSFLAQHDLHPQHSEITYIPRDTIEIKDIDVARKAVKLYDALDEHEDVQSVSTNFVISDELMEQLDEE
ncbi:MAG: YebC/PmpR family DNA-binding transcriptional regulator [Thermoguttaceae bacterium]|jgi:YebC/PmpR family DNA-binding regulatory protein|nr:YebC/PmpR family DNA-binding transcriptional regulator [Thermoguttaceae bacterium]